jgi:hypothetical protein
VNTKLDSIKIWPAHDAKTITFKDKFMKGLPIKNAYLMLYSGVWHVKMSLGGKQRLLGETANGPRAARFADMAILHFLPYRKHRNRPPTDGDFNFGMESAKQDLNDIPEAKELLVQWENALLSRGLIEKVFNDLVDDPAVPQSLRIIRRDIEKSFSKYRMAVLAARLALRLVPEAEIVLKATEEYVSQGAKYNKSLEALLQEYAAVSDPECVARRAAATRAEKILVANKEFTAATVAAQPTISADQTAIENIKL